MPYILDRYTKYCFSGRKRAGSGRLSEMVAQLLELKQIPNEPNMMQAGH
jgi:hypothetical protein